MFNKNRITTKEKNIKFILEKTRKEQEEIVAKILKTVEKKPYPDNKTTHLARFIHSLFQTAPYIKRPELKKEIKEKREEEAKNIKPLNEVLHPSLKPLPSPPSPKPKEKPKINLPKLKPKIKEYVVNLFNTPVGIYVSPDEQTKKYTYQVVEPVINFKVLKIVKELIKKDFKKNKTIINDDEYLKEKIKKACDKLKLDLTLEKEPRNIRYYLKRDLLGFRKIDPLMEDSKVKSIYVEGIDKPVKIEYDDMQEKINTNIIFKDPKDLNVLITKLAKVSGQEITKEKPILNTTFQGIKIQATMGMGDTNSRLTIQKVI